ncbi:serine dehydratase beta chain [Alkalihalobacillus sp. AL-G]|uniref:serine dehydratase beta chain n=1 Tax=Alkalihalobacillus sp. AL-G TaxID=2926399 RepID=UPI00272D2D15|nr:serine dehydratase beta chain [Alkalihalobacillus sp. AL-G]WLD94770.1 hypothetical protein MOJ78_07775 [Alkalihalobacillus sp. AL-G]
MGYNSCFDIIGPIMVGPSSSHTAGAVWIGRAIFEILGETPERVEITLFDSFAETFQGHGTDKALIGGLLGFDTEDERIKHAFDYAEEKNMLHTFILEESCNEFDHPNVAIIKAEKGNRTVETGGASVGGGLTEIFRIDGKNVQITISTNDDLKKIAKYIEE